VRLELDVGNSRVKWRLVSDRVEREGATTLINAQWPEASLDTIWISSVAASSVNEALNVELEQRYGCTPEFAIVSQQCAGVRCGYDDVTRLGVDRWLVLLAAFQCERGVPAIVVDAGSAVTIDLLASGGQHAGGFITPGYRMLQSSLLGQTANIRFEQEAKAQPFGGLDTASCVASGAEFVFAGLASSILTLRAEFNLQARILLTGGDADKLFAYLKSEQKVECLPNLVLDGLTLAEKVTL
jgi:type III pantothenate kinase